ncbi:transcription factor TFIIIB component B'' homolog isoform X2 [Tupaia chinensis]|uniref:transcription factor TFIIIB component B'' homolog isoform X2 n=1 Tax=Tupaia chinensis TaxID=246437 RepID=UPI00070467E7|nr:transcription factor TFIIIB component B'' homolog isoform X2 [Tupaia chinensis]
MFRRARLSVKPNVRPGIGARGSTVPNPQRGQDSPRPPEPALDLAPKPAEPTDVPAVDFGGPERQEKAPRSSDEKTRDENDVEKSSKPSSTVSQRRKRISSTSSLVKPTVSVPSESHPLSTVNQETPQPNPVPSKEKQPCSDRYRIYKAQKLREMLKEELRKEKVFAVGVHVLTSERQRGKKQWKNKYALNESHRPPDRSKMTMRDFIYYLPDNNPMTSSLEQEKKTEKSSTTVQTREQVDKSTPDGEGNEDMEEEMDDGPLLVPRVKVAEDGSIILDEESLTVEVLRTKGPCVIEENDPIFERGSTTTYSSFRKNYYSKPWSNKETDMFFLAISMVGTDFSMIGQLFPHRARIEIKNKFKREEKTNGWRIDKAFQEKRPFDFDFFAHLLQKVLAEEQKRKQKSVKNNSLKEKKSSKPRKNGKAKKVASEGTNDDPDESMSTKISDTERSQNVAQTVEESLTLLGHDLEEVALEQDLNQKNRKKKDQDEVNEREVESLSENASVQPGPSKGEKHKSKCQSLRPEVNEDECNKEQRLSCVCGTDDMELASSEKAEERTDSVLPSSNQQVDSLVATESSESSISQLPSSDIGIRASCEVNNSESAEERNVDANNKSLETDQTENIKPISRGRRQRPKPNLTRAVGKKSVPSEGKTDTESNSSHSETSVETTHGEKDKVNISENIEMVNTERENPETETVSSLSENICLQEDNQPKVFRPARLTRAQLQRAKPNVGKATERKGTLGSQETMEASVGKGEKESCDGRDVILQQLEDQSCKIFEHEDITSQAEKKDPSFHNVQSYEPKALDECPSIQEDNKTNTVKQVPIPRTRFQKPKPNIRRKTGRRDISSKEEVPEETIVTGEMATELRDVVSLDISPREKVPIETTKTTEKESDLKECERRDISLREDIPELINISVEMEAGLKETEREISPREKIPKVIDATEEIHTDLEEIARRETASRENALEEVKPVGEMETDLRETRREISPSEGILKVFDTSEEIHTDLEEARRREIFPQENIPEEDRSIREIEKDLKEPEKEISPREGVSEVIDDAEEIDIGLEKTGKREISLQDSTPEETTPIGEMETALKENEREISPREDILELKDVTEEIDTDLEEAGRREIAPQENVLEESRPVSQIETVLEETKRKISPREEIPEVIDVTEEIDTNLEETGKREISSQDSIPGEARPIGEMETGLKETEGEISPREDTPEMMDVTEKVDTDLEKTGREIAPQENVSEEPWPISEIETVLKETKRMISPRKEISEVIDVTEEIDTDSEETGKREIPAQENTPEEARPISEMETDLKTEKEIFSRDKITEMVDVTEEKERDLENNGRGHISPLENAPKEARPIDEMGRDWKETGVEISLREEILEVMDITEEIDEIDKDLKETGRTEIAPEENVSEEVKHMGEMETGLKENERVKIREVIDATKEKETDLDETERRQIFSPVKVPEEVNTIDKMETDLKAVGVEISQREKVPVEVSAIDEREIDLKETGKRDISLVEKVSGMMTAIEETEVDLKKTGRQISLRESSSEEITVTEKMVANLEQSAKGDLSPRENEPEETDTARQTETNPIQSSNDDCNAMPSLDIKNITSEVLLPMHASVEDKSNSEKEVSSHLSHLKTSQTSELGKTVEEKMRPPDVPEQFSDINLSKSLPQEQKPLEVKPAPFVRSRFKRPKPNLTRAVLKRETTEAKKYVPGKESETDKVETVVIQENREQAGTLPSQHDVASLMTSREKDKLGYEKEEAESPCVQTVEDLSPSNTCDSEEVSQSTQAQGNDLVVSTGTPTRNTFQEEVKDSVIQPSQPVRGRLQRPWPNVRKSGQRQVVEKVEAKGVIMEERMSLQKDETKCENKPNTPSPAQLIRRKFQKPKPNLGRAHCKKNEPGIGKSTTDQNEASKPEDNLLQQGHSDTQLLLKEKSELRTSVEISARKDCIGSRESVLAKKDAPLEVVSSGSVSDEPVRDQSVSSVVEEQHLSKPTSCPQLLKEPQSSKIALDRRTTMSSASEYETGRAERRVRRKIKPNVTRGRGSKRIRSKTSKKESKASKPVLVTLRASQEEDEDDTEDFESDYEESYHLAPEEVNKAPVFVPVGLRSPEPVSAQIEETMEELEITVNVPDVECIAIDEYQLSNTDVTTQEMKQEENLNASFGVTTGEHIQDEPGTNDGSTEAAITLITMGDLVLQSEISAERGDGVCVLPDVHSEDKSHIHFNTDSVNLRIIHEHQELSSPVISTCPASLEENKIVVEEQSTGEEIGLKEKEDPTPTRSTTSKVSTNLRMRNRFAKPKPNLEKILRTSRFRAHQEVSRFSVTKGEEMDTQKETKETVSKASELEGEYLESVTTAESKEQSKLACVHGTEETSVCQEANLTERNEDQEERSQEVPILSVIPTVSSETGPHTLGLDRGLRENSAEEFLNKDSKEDSVLTLHVPEYTPTSIPEVQQENVISPQDLTVNLVAEEHQDGEDEQTFILTLVEIPVSAIENFTDPSAQLLPNSLLPAPILVKSVNTQERGDMSMNLPVTSVGQDTNSGRDDSEKPPANLDLISRKRFHCGHDESDDVIPAKKSPLASRDDCQEYTSEVCSKELLNVFEETEESYKGQGIFPTSGSMHKTPEPQKEQFEPTFQSIEPRHLDKVIDTHMEKNTPQLPQDAMTMSDKEEKTGAANKTEQMGCGASSSKTPLSRPGRRPLGFLSLICSKNSLESDEPTHVHSRKRLKPLIPVLRKNLKRSKPLSESQEKNQNQGSSDLLPSSSVVINTQPENPQSSTAQVSSDQPLLKERSKSGQKRAPEEEPTSVSEYFFSDIFIEVDET